MTNSLIELVAGGQVLRVTCVELYPSEAVAAWRDELATAEANLGRSSSGLGFFGSPGWVLGASIALAAIEGADNMGRAATARRALRAADEALLTIHRAGVMVPVNELDGLYLPSPHRWTAPLNGTLYITTGEEFLVVQLEGGERVHLRWADIATYRALKNGENVKAPSVVLTHDEAKYFLG